VIIAISLTRGKHLASRGICSMRGHVWVMQASLTAPLFIFKSQNHPRIVISHMKGYLFPLWCLQFERCGIFCFSFYNCSNGVVYLFFILWQFERCGIFCFSFYNCSNDVIYFVFHLMTVLTVWYILFFIWWQFERCGIFCFSFYDSSNSVVYFVSHFITVLTMWYILFFIWWQF
jgi:hypothetical protein